jgi:RNA polymerase sigma-70 factor (ECF subfamily)
MQEPSDIELVEGARAGDRESYRLLVERYQTLVYTIALRMVRDRTEAEDIAQEVFLKVYRSLDQFREEASFKTWICRIATNRCIDWKRKHRTREETTHQVEEADRLVDELHERPEQALLRRETQGEVRRAIEKMPEKYRTILLLYHFQGMSYKDIAEQENISARTVETRLYRAKNMLRSALKGGDSAHATSDGETDLELSHGRVHRR